MTDLKRWRGFKDLLRDATEQGASAIERVHLGTAQRPFQVLEQIPPIAEPSKAIHKIHDAVVSTTYGTVRAVTRAVDKAADVALDNLEKQQSSDASQSEPEPESSSEADAKTDA